MKVKLWLLAAAIQFATPSEMTTKDKPDVPSIFNTETWIPLKDLTAYKPWEEGDATDWKENTKPLPPLSDSWTGADTQIFVGMIHYRDYRCPTALADLFDKAEYPDRVHVGIVEQKHTEEEPQYSCVREYCKQKHATLEKGCPHVQNIKIIQLSHNSAKGPNYARFMQQGLRENEEFCLQVDAHSLFAPHWDSLLMTQWGHIDNEYAILSSVAPDISVLKRTNLNKEKNQEVPHVCQAKFDSRGMVVNLPPTVAANLPRPVLAPLWSAGMSFGKCHAEENVPNDPNLQMIFDADEFARFARLWTRGYDVYSPSSIAVTHDYFNVMEGAAKNKANINMEWAQKALKQPLKRILYDRSVDRIATLLGFPEGKGDNSALEYAEIAKLGKYGLGTKRTLDQLIAFTGIDTRRKLVFGDRCTELHWVPYELETDPFVDSGDVWGRNYEVLEAGASNNPILTAGSVTVFPEEAFTNAFLDAREYAANLQVQREADQAAADAANPIKVVEEDAKFLRAKVEEDADFMRHKVQEMVGATNSLLKHRGIELWWVFQPIDSALEVVMNRLDKEIGPGMGSKAMKVFLLLCPVVFLLVLLAFWVLTNNHSNRSLEGLSHTVSVAILPPSSTNAHSPDSKLQNTRKSYTTPGKQQ